MSTAVTIIARLDGTDQVNAGLRSMGANATDLSGDTIDLTARSGKFVRVLVTGSDGISTAGTEALRLIPVRLAAGWRDAGWR